MEATALPGHELIDQGIDDLERGRETVAALLVAIGAPRLRRIGIAVPAALPDHPEHRLYELLARSGSDSAHSRYNALIRRLVSFERAAECVGSSTGHGSFHRHLAEGLSSDTPPPRAPARAGSGPRWR